MLRRDSQVPPTSVRRNANLYKLNFALLGALLAQIYL